MPEWEEIEVPSGSFIGWGVKPGQHVTGRVVEYSIDGGTDYNGGKCPQLAIELTDKAASFDKEGARTDFDAGELVNLTCGQVKLKAAVRKADPNPGDLLKIELTSVERTKNNNTLKEFSIKIARGAGVSAGKPAVETVPNDDEPPF
jgi:hypothetical protein